MVLVTVRKATSVVVCAGTVVMTVCVTVRVVCVTVTVCAAMAASALSSMPRFSARTGGNGQPPCSNFQTVKRARYEKVNLKSEETHYSWYLDRGDEGEDVLVG